MTPVSYAATTHASQRHMLGLSCWPRIGPAAYRATTQEDGLQRGEYLQVETRLG
jgi:hypothetical protein